MNKEKDLQFIKNYSKISISSICKQLNVDRSNLLKNRSSAEKIALVKNEIIKQIEEIIKEAK